MPLRNPRYTGENRCWPCTVLNLGLVALVGGGVALAWNNVVASIVLASGTAAITLRGYAVPGTPQLTGRLPDRVLKQFGKESGSISPNADSVRSVQDLGLLEPGDDTIRLVESVREEYERRARDLVSDREHLEAAVVRTFAEVEEVSVNRSLGGDENWFAKDSDGDLVLKWEARPVVAMDIAAETVLAERVPSWSEYGPNHRSKSRALLRRGSRTCPACGSDFEPDSRSEVVCCGGRSLVGTLRCPACSYAVVDENDLPTDEPIASDGGPGTQR